MNLGCEVGREADKLHLGTNRVTLTPPILGKLEDANVNAGIRFPRRPEPRKPRPFGYTVVTRARLSGPVGRAEAIEMGTN